MATRVDFMVIAAMLIAGWVVPASALYWGTSRMVGHEAWTSMRRYRAFTFVTVPGGSPYPNQITSLRSLCAEQGMALADPRSGSDLSGMMQTLPDATTPFVFDALAGYNSGDVYWWTKGSTQIALYRGSTGVATCQKYCSNINAWVSCAGQELKYNVLAVTGNNGVVLRSLYPSDPPMPNFVCEMTACAGCWNEPYTLGSTGNVDGRIYTAFVGVSNSDTSYDHAVTWCAGKGLQVATIRTQAQQNAVAALNIPCYSYYLAPTTIGHPGTWISSGFSDTATPTTCSGTYCNWTGGQPNNGGGIESYMCGLGLWAAWYWGVTLGKWHDVPYSFDVSGLLCETP